MPRHEMMCHGEGSVLNSINELDSFRAMTPFNGSSPNTPRSLRPSMLHHGHFMESPGGSPKLLSLNSRPPFDGLSLANSSLSRAFTIGKRRVSLPPLTISIDRHQSSGLQKPSLNRKLGLPHSSSPRQPMAPFIPKLFLRSTSFESREIADASNGKICSSTCNFTDFRNSPHLCDRTSSRSVSPAIFVTSRSSTYPAAASDLPIKSEVRAKSTSLPPSVGSSLQGSRRNSFSESTLATDIQSVYPTVFVHQHLQSSHPTPPTALPRATPMRLGQMDSAHGVDLLKFAICNRSQRLMDESPVSSNFSKPWLMRHQNNTTIRTHLPSETTYTLRVDSPPSESTIESTPALPFGDLSSTDMMELYGSLPILSSKDILLSPLSRSVEQDRPTKHLKSPSADFRLSSRRSSVDLSSSSQLSSLSGRISPDLVSPEEATQTRAT